MDLDCYKWSIILCSEWKFGACGGMMKGSSLTTVACRDLRWHLMILCDSDEMVVSKCKKVGQGERGGSSLFYLVLSYCLKYTWSGFN